MNNKVLFVDDEPNVLQAYSRSLRKHYQIVTALSGNEALSLLDPKEPFAVVVSDMRMPGMNGVSLLAKMKEIAPDTVRIMLTGNVDQQTAIDAVNKGDIFRFLNKPCSPEDMARSVNAGIEQHRLIHAERDLLENTVKGSIAALTEVLSLVKPEVFGRVTGHKELILRCAQIMNLDNLWEIETLALLHLIGTVALPDELVSKVLGYESSVEEEEQFRQHVLHGAAIVEKIPRLEELAKGIKYQLKHYDGSGFPADKVAPNDIPLGAQLLKAITDLDKLERLGLDQQTIIASFNGCPNIYAPAVVSALAEVLEQDASTKIVTISVTQITNNMVLAEDLYRRDGQLLLCKGQPLTASAGERLTNFWRNGGIGEYISVVIRTTSE